MPGLEFENCISIDCIDYAIGFKFVKCLLRDNKYVGEFIKVFDLKLLCGRDFDPHS